MAQSKWLLEQVVFGGIIHLQEGLTTIGRHHQCTIVASSDYVSRRHARINVDPNSNVIEITDLGSTNGIFVNDYQYCNASCTLNVGDRIGIGVSVDDSIVSDFSEGKYPIYILKCLPDEENNFIPPDNPQLKPQDEVSASPEPPDKLPDNDEAQCAIDETDDDVDNDNIKENNDLVMPQSNIKKEPEPEAPFPSRKVSENIRSIFGDLNSEVLSTLSEETRKIAEISTNMNKAVAIEDVICISSSEEEEDEVCERTDKRKIPSKSPQLFGDSFNSDGDNPKCSKENVIEHPAGSSVSVEVNNAQENVEQMQVDKPPITDPSIVAAIDEPSTSLQISENRDNGTDNNVLIAELPNDNLKDELDSEEDDLFFTQKLFEEMKELIEDSNEDNPEIKIEPEDTGSNLPIKHEIYPQNLDGLIINVDDEEDEIDEGLEKKLNKWSKLLCSQSFSNSFNASQIYEDMCSDEEPAQTSRNIFIIDDNDDVEMDFVEKAAATAVAVKAERKEDAIEEEPRQSTNYSHKKKNTSKNDEQSLKNLQKELFEPSDEEEAKREEPSSSSIALKKFHEKVIRRISTSEETPTKKCRLNSRSDDNDREEVSRSSSSHRTYSRKSSGNKHSNSSLPTDDIPHGDDLFDKLKKDDKSKKLSSKKRKHEKSSEHNNLKEKESRSPVYHRSSSEVNDVIKTTYKSATVARRKSVRSNSFVDQNDACDFVETKQKHRAEPTVSSKLCEENRRPEPQVPVTQPLKTIRGPPEIIQPPTLPTNRGKLRGISATHQRITETLKSSASINELKRKWLEKPSAKKEKELANARKEDRKKRLKELNDKKQSENVNNACSSIAKETTDCEKESSKQKPKVKVTHANRGAFLVTMPQVPPKPLYRIPKKSAKPNELSKSLPRDLPVINAAKPPSDQRTSNNQIENGFAHQLAQVDILLQKQKVVANRDRPKSTETTNEQKKCAPPRRNTKKVNFDSMNQQFEENSRLLAPKIAPKKVRKVTFKLPPEIHYIESFCNAKRKTYQKESSRFMERKNLIRRQFPIIDKTDNLIDDVLCWSQLWLQNKQVDSNMLSYPMTNQFQSHDNYKSIVIPLLKMEFIGYLTKSMEQYISKPFTVAEIDYSTPHKHRDILFAKNNSTVKQTELAVNDLVLIEIPLGPKTGQYFGLVSNIRRSGNCNCIDVEVTSNSISKEVLKTKPRITIRRIIDGILMHLGTFNAVYQLEQTPLIEKILNPKDLLNVKNNYRTSNIEYKGFNALNTEQRDILLKTYAKSIDQFNPNVSLINGPPGTGKSVLISNLAIQLLYGNEVHELDKKILICAQSNMAVDVIAEKLLKIKQKLSPETPQYHVVRFGVEEKVHPNVKDITLKSLLQRHRMNVIRTQTNLCNQQAINTENLNTEILQLEAQIAELERITFQDVRQEELTEMRKNLALKKFIINQTYRPEDEKRLNKWFLENANIVCSTLSSCVKLASYIDYFDVCIIDEATQCTEPWTLMPLKFGVSNLVMVGDTQQLPATVISQSAKELGLGMSLFTRIQKCLESKYLETSTPQAIKDDENKPIFTLHEQYRMHSEISKWPNMYFYKNQLRNNPKTDEFKSSIQPFSILNLEYRQNNSNYGQISNSLEAEFVVKLVTTLDNYIPNKFFSYGVITPYAQHREKLEHMIRNSGLKDIMVNTIDSYQGIEKDVIIISNARTRGVGFLANYQRLNVALTRPKKCLILCGSFKNLESVPSWASLLANAKMRRLYHNISTTDALDITKNVIEKIKIKR